MPFSLQTRRLYRDKNHKTKRFERVKSNLYLQAIIIITYIKSTFRQTLLQISSQVEEQFQYQDAITNKSCKKPAVGCIKFLSRYTQTSLSSLKD